MNGEQWNQKGNEYLVKQEFGLAMDAFQTAAEEGNYFAMYSIACMYYFGDGVEKDDRQALIWYEKAAEHGDSEAMDRAGSMRLSGLGCSKDEAEAYRCYLKSAMNGSLSGMGHAGLCLLKGIGTKINRTEGLYWLEQASSKGNGIASVELGDYYLSQKDIPKGIAYLKRGTEQKYAPAFLRLAELYEAGTLVERDCSYAEKLREMAETAEEED